MLDKAGIKYDLREYPVDENNLGAEYVAEKTGLPAGQVFKTLVARGDRTGVLLACIPGAAELDLKALAAVSGNKRVDMVHLREVCSLTGYIRGGVSPLGTKKTYPVYIDGSAFSWPVIMVSAGVRGCQIIINPHDLAGVLKARTGQLTHS